jgi:alginate O-acetyltransferase complex protein AlgI
VVFSSPIFAVFLLIAFAGYWSLQRADLKWQNGFVLVASYVFYGWWDWRFLSLIAISTLVDFIVAQKIENNSSQHGRKKWLWLSLWVNLGMLGVFKYFNFFVSEFQEFLSLFGMHTDPWTLSIVLPVGISFYTFQTLSYTLDVYNKKMKASQSLLQFAAYVSFFPQLVAGPIERAVHLLPQFEKRRTFDFELAKAGVRLIVWGLFKKIVIADSLAPMVNKIFAGYEEASGGTLAIGAVLFAFQIYGDFSGYSDIAIGTARLLGFDLMSNFKFPYFSRNIGEFWRRWHISLSTWFRDYLYIPLGGSRGSKAQQIRNIFVIFLVSGFWHGANWTFIAWGALHALLFLPLFLLGSNRKHLPDSSTGSYDWRDWLSVITTFIFVCVGWIFFRAESISQALMYIGSLFNTGAVEYSIYLLFPAMLVLLEWPLRHDERLEHLQLGRLELPLIGLFMALIFVFRDTATEFIYFQF